jgi:hypothetical protein
MRLRGVSVFLIGYYCHYLLIFCCFRGKDEFSSSTSVIFVGNEFNIFYIRLPLSSFAAVLIVLINLLAATASSKGWIKTDID